MDDSKCALHGQTAGDERPAPNVGESRPHSEEESHLGEQQRARTEKRTKRHAEAGPRFEDETLAKQRAEDETRAKQRAETESRAKQAASSPDEEDEENEEHSSSRKKAKYDRNCWYVVCATMIIVMRVLR